MEQMFVTKNTTKYTEPRPLQRPAHRIRGNPGAYYVQSFNPKKKQLWYKVVLRPFEDHISCACEYFKHNPGLICKHILKVVELENGLPNQ